MDLIEKIKEPKTKFELEVNELIEKQNKLIIELEKIKNKKDE